MMPDFLACPTTGQPCPMPRICGRARGDYLARLVRQGAAEFDLPPAQAAAIAGDYADAMCFGGAP